MPDLGRPPAAERQAPVQSVGVIRVEHTVTTGTFSLDGEVHSVENNVWVVGDDLECVVVDAPHDVDAVLAVVGDRTLRAILCTHAHDDHVRYAPELRARTGAQIYLHPDDRPLWDLTHPDERWDVDLFDRQQISVCGAAVTVLHTPGHAPGGVCFLVESLGALFSGDTLFKGGPGATGRSYSDRPTLVSAISRELMTLPDDIGVHTGHGPDTTIGAERPGLGRGSS